MDDAQRAALENALKLIDVLYVHTQELSQYAARRLAQDVKNRELDTVRDQLVAVLQA